MSRPNRKKSSGLIHDLRRGLELVDQAEKPFYCFRLNQLGVELTREQRDKMNDAQSKIYDAKEEVKKVYEQLIGEAIVKEISMGAWK